MSDSTFSGPAGRLLGLANTLDTHNGFAEVVASLRAGHGGTIGGTWGSASALTASTLAEALAASQDRSGLLRDISEVFSRLRLNVIGVNTQSKASLAHMGFTVEIHDGAELSRAISALSDVAGVISAVRR